VKVSEMFPGRYLSGDDLQGQPMTVTIARIGQEEMRPGGAAPVKKWVVWFQGEQKAVILGLTLAEQIAEAVGSDDTNDWPGRRVTLYPLPLTVAGESRVAIRARAANGATAAPVQSGASTVQLTRPLTPVQVKEAIQRKVARATPAQRTTEASAGQRGLLAGKLEECWPADPDAARKRRSVTVFLIGRQSVSEATAAEGSALLDWLLDPASVAEGTYDLHPAARQEAEAILREALVAAGQTSLPLGANGNRMGGAHE